MSAGIARASQSGARMRSNRVVGQKSARRLIRSIVAASCSRSCGASCACNARSSQSSRAALPLLRVSRPAALRQKKVCRPSLGSCLPLTKPFFCRLATVTRMDCGRTLSARASVDTVTGPSRSSRMRTDFCAEVNSPACACSRSRRFSLPTETRSSAARVETREADAEPEDLLIHPTIYAVKLYR
jgi:hypothetical protein